MKFFYQARTIDGDIKSGVVEASSREAALDLLQKMGLFVTYLEEEEKPSFFTREIKIFQRVSLRDLVLFSRQFAIMLNSKIPLVETLSTLGRQTANPKLKEIILEITKEVEAGSRLAKAFSKHQDVFSPFFVAMIKAGESAGKLPEALNYLADHLEREYNLRSKVIGALIYPAFVLLVFFAIGAFAVFSILPSFQEIYVEISKEVETTMEMPMITKFVLSFGQLLREYFVYIFLALVLPIIFLFYYSRTPGGKKNLDKICLETPILGKILKYSLISRFSENLSTLSSAGIMIPEALTIIKEIMENKIYQEAISHITEGVKKGSPISSISRLYPEIFPPLFNQMVFVGEKTGNLDQCLLDIANFYQKEAEREIENFMRLLEPILIILLGGAVGILVGAVILPLYKIIASV